MKKVRQISAMVGIILIALMYLISAIAAIFASKQAPGLFLSSVFLTVIIPILIYAFVELYKYVHRDDIKKKKDEESEEEGK